MSFNQKSSQQITSSFQQTFTRTNPYLKSLQKQGGGNTQNESNPKRLSEMFVSAEFKKNEVVDEGQAMEEVLL